MLSYCTNMCYEYSSLYSLFSYFFTASEIFIFNFKHIIFECKNLSNFNLIFCSQRNYIKIKKTKHRNFTRPSMAGERAVVLST